MKTVIYVFFLSVFFISCSENKKEINIDDEISSSEIFLNKFDDNKLKEKLKNRVYKGDTIAYNELKEMYYLSGNKKDLLFYSIYMVNNYKYLDAYEDCYNILKDKNLRNDHFNNKLANYYLLLGYEKNKEAFEMLVKEVFINEVPNSNNILCRNSED